VKGRIQIRIRIRIKEKNRIRNRVKVMRIRNTVLETLSYSQIIAWLTGTPILHSAQTSTRTKSTPFANRSTKPQQYHPATGTNIFNFMKSKLEVPALTCSSTVTTGTQKPYSTNICPPNWNQRIPLCANRNSGTQLHSTKLEPAHSTQQDVLTGT
jgi:hypothetical protein